MAAAELLRYSDANARLHALIRDIAAHATATGIIERLRAQLVRHQFTLSLVPGRPAESLAQHERIVAAIAARDPAAGRGGHARPHHQRDRCTQGPARRRAAGRGPAEARAGGRRQEVRADR